jgi:hypothetical protein
VALRRISKSAVLDTGPPSEVEFRPFRTASITASEFSLFKVAGELVSASEWMETRSSLTSPSSSAQGSFFATFNSKAIFNFCCRAEAHAHGCERFYRTPFDVKPIVLAVIASDPPARGYRCCEPVLLTPWRNVK